MICFLKKSLLLPALLAVTPWAARAEVVLLVDITNPAAVKITATSAFAQAAGPAVPQLVGIDLLQFFTAPVDLGVGYFLSSTLTPPGGGAYLNFEDDNYSGSDIDLNLLDGGNLEDPQNFNTSSPAFTGEGTLDLSGVAAYLPAFGASGNVLNGANDATFGTVVGQWQAVPEPSTYVLLALVVLFLVVLRRPSFLLRR